ncbi:MAG: ParA family protein [Sphingobacteriales bacterium]|nr:MAG: ParA family protein [Sphingobacteriales bacterium]
MIATKEASEHFGLTGPRLKQLVKENGIPTVKLPNGFLKFPNETMAKLNNLRNIKYRKTVATIAIEKGGSGKTVITLNLALTAARYGLKVLVCDFDPECCASLFLAPDNVEWRDLGSIYEVFEKDKQIIDYTKPSRFEGVDFLPGKILVRRLDKTLDSKNPKNILSSKMKILREKYDLILFDLPPSFNKLCASSYLTSDVVICPVNSDVFSLDSLNLTIEDIESACTEFEANMPPIYVLKNRFAADHMRRKASKVTSAELNRDFAESLLPMQIRASATIENCLNAGITLYDAPKSETGIEEIKRAFYELFNFICDRQDAEETKGRAKSHIPKEEYVEAAP